MLIAFGVFECILVLLKLAVELDDLRPELFNLIDKVDIGLHDVEVSLLVGLALGLKALLYGGN